jgi:hypothetical protein
MLKESHCPLKPFETGQIWELMNSRVLIGQVGKLLVSYQQFKGKKKFRVPTALCSKQELEKYLSANKAVLV